MPYRSVVRVLPARSGRGIESRSLNARATGVGPVAGGVGIARVCDAVVGPVRRYGGEGIAGDGDGPGLGEVVGTERGRGCRLSRGGRQDGALRVSDGGNGSTARRPIVGRSGVGGCPGRGRVGHAAVGGVGCAARRATATTMRLPTSTSTSALAERQAPTTTRAPGRRLRGQGAPATATAAAGG